MQASRYQKITGTKHTILRCESKYSTLKSQKLLLQADEQSTLNSICLDYTKSRLDRKFFHFL